MFRRMNIYKQWSLISNYLFGNKYNKAIVGVENVHNASDLNKQTYILSIATLKASNLPPYYQVMLLRRVYEVIICVSIRNKSNYA